VELRSQKNIDSDSSFRALRRAGGFLLQGLICVLCFATPLVSRAADSQKATPTLHGFVHDMPKTIRADHPAILPVADAIRKVTTNPLEQLVMVNDVTHLLVDYDDDLRVYGHPEYFATLDEMLAKRRQEGWIYLRDDCDGRAVFAAHLLASLGIPWRLEASFWKRHAWVTARVDGVEYDLIDYRPDATAPERLSYRLVGHWFVRASRQPPLFDWRRRWAECTQYDLVTGLRLGLLTLDSTPGNLHQRHSTDWTEEAPHDYRSPSDPRMLTAAMAGFPYGEMLRGVELADARERVAVSPPPAALEASPLKPALATNSSRGLREPAPAPAPVR
jgi:hypothetical protein